MKINRFFLCLATTLLLFGCSNNNTSSSSSNALNESLDSGFKDNSSSTSSKEENNSKDNCSSSDSNEKNNIKVVYFSCTNTTEQIAYKISNYLDCNIDEIIPLIPYSSDDLNYSNNSSRANIEQNDVNARPEIKNTINFENINTIFLGYPIWWGKLPKIIYTFLDTYNFDNFTIIPFCTSGGSGISTSVNEIKQLESNAQVLDGIKLSSNASESEVKSFVDSLNL